MQAALRPSARPAPRLAPATSYARPSVAAAAKPTKAADFRAMSDDDIKAAVAEGKMALWKLRMAQKTRQVRGRRGRGVLRVALRRAWRIGAAGAGVWTSDGGGRTRAPIFGGRSACICSGCPVAVEAWCSAPLWRERCGRADAAGVVRGRGTAPAVRGGRAAVGG